MRVILLIFLSIPFFSKGQTLKAVLFNSNVHRAYEPFTVTMITDKNQDPKFTGRNTYTLNFGQKRKFLDYKIIRESDGVSYIRVLPRVMLHNNEIVPVPDSIKQLKSDDTNAYNYIFAIDTRDLKYFKKVPLTNRFLFVPLVHPFKLRPAHNGRETTVTSELTVSYNIGLRTKVGGNILKPLFVTLVPYGAGLSYSKYFTRNEDGTFTRPDDAFVSFTYYSGGIFFTFDKYNIGLFAGKDTMFANSQKDWHYQNKWWFSFGLGFKFKND